MENSLQQSLFSQQNNPTATQLVNLQVDSLSPEILQTLGLLPPTLIPPTTVKESESKPTYKLKVINPSDGGKYVVRMWHDCSKVFKSIKDLKEQMAESFGDHLYSNIPAAIGYFDGRHQTKRWLCTDKDLEVMYATLTMREIFLWCEVQKPAMAKEKKRCAEDDSNADAKRGKQRRTKRDIHEDQCDEYYEELSKIHGDNYSSVQLRLWARMLANGLHNDKNEPPAVPMITGVTPKRPKKESLQDTIVCVAKTFADAFIDKKVQKSSPELSLKENISVAHGVSPGRAADVRMKNYEQLRYLQSLLDDGILSLDEFCEQKQTILFALKKL